MLELDEKLQVRIQRSTDASLIKRVITHPRVYPHVSDDSSPDPEKFYVSEAVKHPNVYFLLAYDGNELLGLFMVHQHNGVMYEVHTCLLPNAWGEKATEAGKKLIRWVFENTPCEKLITFVPEGNTLALRFAKRCGLRLEGLVTKSYRKGGRLLNQSLLGVEKCL